MYSLCAVQSNSSSSFELKIGSIIPSLATISCQKISSTIQQKSSHFNEYFLLYTCECVYEISICVTHMKVANENFMVNYIRLPLACSTRKCSLISIHAVLMMNSMNHWILMTIFFGRNQSRLFHVIKIHTCAS